MPLADKEAYKAYQKAYREKNKEALKEKRKNYFKAYNVQYYAKNSEKAKASASKWREENKERLAASNQAYRDNNVEERKKRTKKWRMENQDKVIADMAKRRYAKMQRTPKWLTNEQLKQIQSFYHEAKMLEVETGLKHHVDHIIPLQGKLASGLHVPENLRVITAIENHRKFNKFIV
jgi:hypothetical protein